MGLTAAREGLAEVGTRNWAMAQRATGKAPFYMYMFSRVHPFAAGRHFLRQPAGDRRVSHVGCSLLVPDAGRLQQIPDDARLDAFRPRSVRPDDRLPRRFRADGRSEHGGNALAAVDAESRELFRIRRQSGVREENVERMDFYTPANVTPWTPPTSRD